MKTILASVGVLALTSLTACGSDAGDRILSEVLTLVEVPL